MTKHVPQPTPRWRHDDAASESSSVKDAEYRKTSIVKSLDMDCSDIINVIDDEDQRCIEELLGKSPVSTASQFTI